MTHNHFTIEAHAAANEPELAIAVCGLVKIHEIHVNAGPGDFTIELCMQVQDGFVEQAQTSDPHFSGRKGVHPCD
jgi:hypothetical protein